MLLALLLHGSPVIKAVQTASVLAGSPFAVVLQFAAVVAAVTGGHHAVSGASSSVLITSPTNSVGTNGTAYRYIITQNSPNPDSGHAFGASNRPSNLTLTVVQGSAPAIGILQGTPTNFGVWLVRLTATYNDGGNILSAVPTNMLLTVYGKPVLTNQPANAAGTTGGSASFGVVADALPPPTYRWRFNGATISGQTNATLNLSNLAAGDAGNYTVVLSNFVGSVTSSVAMLTVTSGTGPAIVTPPHAATAFTGGGTNFSVAATGTAPLGYFWRKDGVPIPGANGTVLPLSNLTTNDAGSYSVTVSNAINSVTSAAATLNVVRTNVFLTIDSSNADVILRFLKDAGASYDLLYSPSLDQPVAVWQVLTNLPPSLQGTNAAVTSATTNDPARLYKLRVTIP